MSQATPFGDHLALSELVVQSLRDLLTLRRLAAGNDDPGALARKRRAIRVRLPFVAPVTTATFPRQVEWRRLAIFIAAHHGSSQSIR